MTTTDDRPSAIGGAGAGGMPPGGAPQGGEPAGASSGVPGARNARRNGGAEVASPGIRASLRSSSFWIVAGILVLAASVVLLLVKGISGTASSAPLSIDSAAPAGSRALAEVLRQHGVTVTAAHSLAEAQKAATGDSTVLIYDPDQLLPGDRYADAAALGSRLVLVEPDVFELEALAPTIAAAGAPDFAGSDNATLSAQCELPAARSAGTISVSGTTYRAVGETAVTESCFPSFGTSYSLVRAGSVTVLGAPEVLDNGHITLAGNAALAVGLLGTSSSVVWYTPSAADVTANGPPSLGALTPGWVTPALSLLVLVFVAGAVWRGRRLGPVVVENLPVIVRASETIGGRARLYARSGARTHALDALRIGTSTRLAVMLGLPRTAPLELIITQCSAVTGMPATEVAATLVNQLPGSEGDLVELAQRLAGLEGAVRASLGLGGPS
ncbi:DUF4350 domain-containing protein [Subtercola sp. PAMC28395]|uniref:DUF4350 domain-containing protein n=1 Tax=Subtercola sp. PAMC28395 TaxID=2846775 RepID=UPI001C0E0018|nr:DUF4350 domain-containing protein [Subtercola sp. PAMC28395]QWT25058.1 DUF4350 domain-containing protein [Subtercola sp. PAMC28395]